MNIFKNKFLVKLIATICLFLALISFGTPTKVYADDEGSWGGVLITPVIDLLTSFGDGIMELLHSSVQSQQISMIKIDGSTDWNKTWALFWSGVIGVIAAAVVVGTIMLGGVAVSSILAAVGSTAVVGTTITLGVVATGSIAGALVGKSLYEGWVPDDLYLPAFSITAEEIFSNEIPLFDINFFNPMDPKKVETGANVNESKYERLTVYYGIETDDKNWEDGIEGMDILISPEDTEVVGEKYKYDLLIRDLCGEYAGKIFTVNEMIDKLSGHENQEKTTKTLNNILNRIDAALEKKEEKKINRDQPDSTTVTSSEITKKGTKEKYDVGKISILHGGSPETGGPKKVIILLTEVTKANSTPITKTVYSTADQLHDVVSKWYYVLRNLAIAVLMVVLIYTGIRIVLASTAGEKAKYKERIIDWVVAMCLLFVMHYIMVFSVNIVNKVISLVDTATVENGNFMVIPLTEEQNKNAKVLFEEDEYGKKLVEEKIAEYDASIKQLSWKTDLAGMFRIESQTTAEGTAKWAGYAFSYCVLVIFTVCFAWTYLKRVVYMAFLTMIAPLVAMTYPIDKITDGKAQAFNSWLKEYIFNLLIQPMHLLLYTVLVNSAYELASESAIFALVALGFMLPAEKMMRKFFGFEKASTPGLLGGAAGAALAMTGINKFLGHKPKGGHSGGKDSGGNESKDSVKMNYKTSEAIGGMKGIAGEPTEDTRTSTSKINTEELEDDETSNKTDFEKGEDPHQGNDDPIMDEEQELQTNNTYEQLQKQRNQSEWDKFIKERENNKNRKLQDKWKDRRTEKKQDRKDRFDDFLSKHSTMKDAYDGMQGVAKGFTYNHPYIASHIKGTKAATGAYYRALGKRMGDKIANGHPIRAMARGAAGLAGAATFGAMGLAAGVVSGDPSKAFQYAGGAALGGAKFGSSTAGAFMKATSVDQDYLQEQYDLEAYGNEYKNYMIEQEKQKMQESEKYINYLQKTMSLTREQAQDALKTTGSQCFDSGITNVEDIATIHKMIQLKDPETNKNYTIEQAIGAKKFNDQLPSDVNKMSRKKKDEYIKGWKSDYEDAGYGKKSDYYANKSMELAIKFSNTQSSLKKSQI